MVLHLLAYNRGDLADVAYADGTLLLGTSDPHLQDYLSQIADAGLFHRDKFQLLQITSTMSSNRSDSDG